MSKPAPLVSCIMPTCNRPAFVPYAIRYFLWQDYKNKELVIVDDGTNSIRHLVPDDKQIRYIKTDHTMTFGEKTNFCVRESRGSLIMQWDDDDWMAPHRISYQVRELMAHDADICGLQQILYCDVSTGRCWLYKYPAKAWPWLAGNSWLYKKTFWEQQPFPDVEGAYDTHYMFSRKLENYVVLKDYSFYVAAIHASNSCSKVTTGPFWNPIDPSVVKNIVGSEPTPFYGLFKDFQGSKK